MSYELVNLIGGRVTEFCRGTFNTAYVDCLGLVVDFVFVVEVFVTDICRTLGFGDASLNVSICITGGVDGGGAADLR